MPVQKNLETYRMHLVFNSFDKILKTIEIFFGYWIDFIELIMYEDT